MDLIESLQRSFQGWKGQVWLIFKYFTILYSNAEVLLKFIASCRFSGMILVLVIFEVRKFQFGPLFIYLANISETVHAIVSIGK